MTTLIQYLVAEHQKAVEKGLHKTLEGDFSVGLYWIGYKKAIENVILFAGSEMVNPHGGGLIVHCGELAMYEEEDAAP